MIVSHETVRHAVVSALMRNPTSGVQEAMEQAAKHLSLPVEAVAEVIDAKTDGDHGRLIN